MENDTLGMILCGTGGLYTVLLDDGRTLRCKARGLFRAKKITPLAGDRVKIRYGDSGEKGYFIENIYPRKTELSRPPIANLDTVFISLSPASPEPNLFYTDKLICSAINAGITPAVVVTKSDIDDEKAAELEKIYSPAFPFFKTSSENSTGKEELLKYIMEKTHICAFAGASGVGKSTLINTMFPEFSLKTGAISEHSGRGKHTTRTVSLIQTKFGGFVADTPGFTMLELENQPVFDYENLFFLFPEFEKFFGKCKYRGCTHTKEEGCAVLDAVEHGIVAKSRHESYLALFAEGKNKKKG